MDPKEVGMTSYGIQPGDHSVARPLPAPPRTAAVSKGAQEADRLTRALEEWLVEVKLRYTLGGD